MVSAELASLIALFMSPSSIFAETVAFACFLFLGCWGLLRVSLARKLPRFEQSYKMAIIAVFESNLTAHNYRFGNFTLVNYFVI